MIFIIYVINYMPYLFQCCSNRPIRSVWFTCIKINLVLHEPSYYTDEYIEPSVLARDSQWNYNQTLSSVISGPRFIQASFISNYVALNIIWNIQASFISNYVALNIIWNVKVTICSTIQISRFIFLKKIPLVLLRKLIFYW